MGIEQRAYALCPLFLIPLSFAQKPTKYGTYSYPDSIASG